MRLVCVLRGSGWGRVPALSGAALIAIAITMLLAMCPCAFLEEGRTLLSASQIQSCSRAELSDQRKHHSNELELLRLCLREADSRRGIQKMLRIWSPRSLWGYLYKCSLQRTVVGVPPKKCQIIFYWIPVGKPSFNQRVRLV